MIPLMLLEAGLRLAHLFVRDEAPSIGSAEQCVLCVGDSHTYGVYFPRAASYPARLQTYLDALLGPERVSVVPAARPGLATAQMRDGLPELLARRRPKLVLVLGGINDRWNGDDRGAVPQFLARHLRVWTLAMMLVAQQRGEVLDATTERPAASSSGLLLEGPLLESEIVANLGAIRRACAGAGATPIFLTYAPPDPVFATTDAAIRRVAREERVELIDLATTFDAALRTSSYDALLIPGDFHPRPAGYDLIAREVARRILPRLGGPTLSELPPLPPADAAPTIRMAIDPKRASVLAIEGPPLRRFHVYLSGTARPPATLRRVLLPLCATDALFRLALELPQLRGALDANGRAEIELGADKLSGLPPGPDGLLAAATLLDASAPTNGDDALWAVESTAVVTILPPRAQRSGGPPK